jgi:hypothetical protein
VRTNAAAQELRQTRFGDVPAYTLIALDVAPIVGRRFRQADHREGAAGTALLSYGRWQREFGGNDAVVGTTVRLDDQPYTIIGVMPREFGFPSRNAQLWPAMRFASAEVEDRNNNYLHALGRLRVGTSLDAE